MQKLDDEHNLKLIWQGRMGRSISDVGDSLAVLRSMEPERDKQLDQRIG
ncbi:hypothetical protein M8494_21860 [Serratia ureilytica]